MASSALPMAPRRRRITIPGSRMTWLAVLLIVPALLPLASPGYFFKAHDAQHSVFFLVEFDRAVQSGVIWPVWGPDHAIGFGYPTWLVYAPLAYCLGEIFHLLGLGFAAAVKAVWALGFLLGGLGVYLLARRWWSPAAGLVAALVYTYAPYHLVQIYVRNDFAEFVAVACVPWALLALADLWEKPGPRAAGLAALAVGALLLSHTVSQLAWVPLLAGFVILELLTTRPLTGGRWAWRPTLWSVLGLGLGGLLAMIFWLPAIVEKTYVNQAQWVQQNYSYLVQFVYPNQLFSPFWGFGYAVAGPQDGMSFQLGLLPFLAALAGTCVAIRPGQQGLPRRAAVLFLAAVSLFCVLAMTPALTALWQIFPLAALFQFPWRLLMVTTVTFALLTGAAVYWLENRPGQGSVPGPYVFVAALAVVLASFAYTRPQIVPIRPEDESPLAVLEFETQYPDMRGMTRWSQRMPADADSPLIAQYRAGQPLQRAAVIAGQGTILAQRSDAVSAYARVSAGSEIRLRFYTYYFPGWGATVDGKPVAVTPDPPNGLIGLEVPAGEHEIRVRFGTTPVRTVGVLLTLGAVVAVLGLFVAERRLPKSRI